MGCCGPRRTSTSATVVSGTSGRPEVHRQSSTSPAPSAASRVASPSAGAERTAASGPGASPSRLRYTGVAEIAVRGQASGRTYVFSSRAPERLVEGRDVVSLMRMGLFRRSG